MLKQYDFTFTKMGYDKLGLLFAILIQLERNQTLLDNDELNNILVEVNKNLIRHEATMKLLI